MNILVLTKDKNFFAAKDIANHLADEGHYVEIQATKPPFDLPPEEFGDEWDLGISVHYNHILKQDDLDKFKYGVINIHPSLLPYGRGSDPCVWAIYDNQPSGITIHWIDEGIDTGNLLFQLPVEKGLLETGESLYYKLISYYKYVFPLFWVDFSQKLNCGVVPKGKAQSRSERVNKRTDLPHQLEVTGLILDLFALSHSEHRNAYMVDENGKEYWVKLVMEEKR
jgi:methionyl-tRNA formyltransferase